MQEILEGLGIPERDLIGECIRWAPSFCERWLQGQGCFLYISWKPSDWGQQDTAKEQHSLVHGGSVGQPRREAAELGVGKQGD